MQSQARQEFLDTMQSKRRFSIAFLAYTLAQNQHSRRGVIVILAATAFAILIASTMLSVDTAYIHLTRTELRVATDAAAKAGAEALLRTQNESQAIAAAQAMAAANRVAGHPLYLTAGDIKFGSASLANSGSWTFNESVRPYNSVRVLSALNSSNANGPVRLFFGGIVGQGTYQPTKESTATVFQQDVMLCIDRSHSMCFDLSGTDWVYPSGRSSSIEIKNPPHATRSRWASLARAVEDYLVIVGDVEPRPRIGLITWASEIGTNTTEYQLTGQTSPKTFRESSLSTSYQGVRDGITRRSSRVMLGGTDLSSGLDLAIAEMKASDRPLAKKVIVLMTDGNWNQGRNPRLSAADAHHANIIVHTITFLPGTSQADMKAVAEATGGRHYHADSESELRAAFQELARSLPVVLTE